MNKKIVCKKCRKTFIHKTVNWAEGAKPRSLCNNCMKIKKVDVVCQNCSKTFKAKRRHAKYCPACKKEAYNRKRRQKRSIENITTTSEYFKNCEDCPVFNRCRSAVRLHVSPFCWAESPKVKAFDRLVRSYEGSGKWQAGTKEQKEQNLTSDFSDEARRLTSSA